MTYTDFALARTLLAEEKVGSAERAAKEQEKAAAKAARKALTRGAR